MKPPKSKKVRDHIIYAIYNEQTDELAAVSLDYHALDMQLQLNEFGQYYSIVEFTVRLVDK
jgi:hypothetical protein